MPPKAVTVIPKTSFPFVETLHGTTTAVVDPGLFLFTGRTKVYSYICFKMESVSKISSFLESGNKLFATSILLLRTDKRPSPRSHTRSSKRCWTT